MTAYTIVLSGKDCHPTEEAFIVEARRKAREERLARVTEGKTLKFLLLSHAV